MREKKDEIRVQDFLYWLEDNEREAGSGWSYYDCVGKTASQALKMLIKEDRHYDCRPVGSGWNVLIEPEYGTDQQYHEEEFQYEEYKKDCRKQGLDIVSFKRYRIDTFLSTLA